VPIPVLADPRGPEDVWKALRPVIEVRTVVTRLGITPEQVARVYAIVQRMVGGQPPTPAEQAELDAFTAACRAYALRVDERCAEVEQEVVAGVDVAAAWLRDRRGDR
jgi:hypothetical protein